MVGIIGITKISSSTFLQFTSISSFTTALWVQISPPFRANIFISTTGILIMELIPIMEVRITVLILYLPFTTGQSMNMLPYLR